jgi:hypothetical protein
MLNPLSFRVVERQSRSTMIVSLVVCCGGFAAATYHQIGKEPLRKDQAIALGIRFPK